MNNYYIDIYKTGQNKNKKEILHNKKSYFLCKTKDITDTKNTYQCHHYNDIYSAILEYNNSKNEQEYKLLTTPNIELKPKTKFEFNDSDVFFYNE